MIQEINVVSEKLNNSAGNSDPVSKSDNTQYTLKKTKQIQKLSHVVRVLNSHLQQLQQIDQEATSLQSKVQEAQKQARAMGGSEWRIGSNPADDFYKSLRR
jgi:nuclear pore complex protein Nup62